MARKLTLKIIGVKDLGFASAGASAVDISDWSELLHPSEFTDDETDIVLPPVTFQAVSDHAADLLTDAQRRTADRFPDREVSEELAEEFRESDGYYEWKDSFSPMMNYVWPVMLAYGTDADTVAALLQEFCPVITLVSFGRGSDHCPEEYGFALSGGGMNLADEIATAYLCAGAVPPTSLLESLAGVISEYKLKKVGGPLRLAYRKAAEYHTWRAKAVRSEGRRIFAKRKTEG